MTSAAAADSWQVYAWPNREADSARDSRISSDVDAGQQEGLKAERGRRIARHARTFVSADSRDDRPFPVRILQVIPWLAPRFGGPAILVPQASVALAAQRRFYARRQRQYASESSPPKLLLFVPPATVFAVTLAAWYATIFHYRPWGWVVTLFLTALSCLAADHVFRWQKHRRRMLKVVANPKVWQIDCLLLVLGSGFVALALLVY